jgi:iron uptake system component EfeO
MENGACARVGAALVAAVAIAGVLAVAAAGRSPESTPTHATSGTKTRVVRVTLPPAGCPASLVVPPGRTTFVVSNHGGDAISELEVWHGEAILGEIENLAPGMSGAFSLNLRPGTYRTNCPGLTQFAHGKLRVS